MAEEKQLAKTRRKDNYRSSTEYGCKGRYQRSSKREDRRDSRKERFLARRKIKKTEQIEEKLAEYDDLRVRQLNGGV